MNLVIVESAAKAKTIAKYLNETSELKTLGSFKVIASFGHINDLPPKELGIDKNKWTATYVPLDSKKKVIADIKKEAKKAKRIYIASDLDMEGEAIANHLRHTLGLGANDYERITFNEITKSALRDAVLHPRRINMDMVHAQEARRFMDRVVGYELSPLLWRRFATSRLSAGRVQSVALKMIVDKEAETRQHEPEPYWNMRGEFKVASAPDVVLSAKTEATWDSEKDITKVINFLSRKSRQQWNATFSREAKRNPSAPFVTSSLQQEAYSRLGLHAKRTMQIAQVLYEAGHITYMRTDSPTISLQAQDAIVEFIKDKYGADHVLTRTFKSKAANAQEAHECIRPTKITVTSGDLDDVDAIHKKLYDLIWRRAVASQMIHATYSELVYVITTNDFSEEFKGKHELLISPGYLKVYDPSAAKTADMKSRDKLEKLVDEGALVTVVPQSFVAKGDVTRPPPLYNEPMLVKALEKEGIGRPSTYAAIIDKLFAKGYVLKGMNPASKTVHVKTFSWAKGASVKDDEETIVVGGTDSDKYISTSLGERVSEYVSGIVPFLVQKKFTSEMEKELDLISDGHKNKKAVLDEFYTPFSDAIAKALREQKAQKAQKASHEDTTSAVCDRLKPSDKMVMREFVRLGVKVVQTRYGPALLKERDNKWVSLMPFLKWREKTIEELSEKDVRFLYSLPMKVGSGDKYEVHMGRYGLYLKDSKNQNLRLAKDDWNTIYDGHDVSKIAPSAGAPAKPSKRR
jgi:DNA topoisomerase-1